MSSTAAQNVLLQPHYLKGTKGNLFVLSALPENKQKTVYLFLPSFAEELNRCRVMVSMQARNFVADGEGCLLLDYYGTGDSEGDFSENSWLQWQSDVDSAYQWLAQEGYQNIVLWGLRLGAMLALVTASQYPERFSRLLLWQPVLDGKVLLTQFLRIRIAMLMDRGLKKETTSQMRAELASGQSLEVAGYEITPEFAAELDQLKMMDYSLPDNMPAIDWFEASIQEGNALSLGTQKLVAAWEKQNIVCRTHSYSGPFFWQLHERELTPILLEKTTQLVNDLHTNL